LAEQVKWTDKTVAICSIIGLIAAIVAAASAAIVIKISSDDIRITRTAEVCREALVNPILITNYHIMQSLGDNPKKILLVGDPIGFARNQVLSYFSHIALGVESGIYDRVSVKACLGVFIRRFKLSVSDDSIEDYKELLDYDK